MAVFQIHEDLENIAPRQAKVFQNTKPSKLQDVQKPRQIFNDITNEFRGTKRGRVVEPSECEQNQRLLQKRFANSPLNLERLKLLAIETVKKPVEDPEIFENEDAFDPILNPKEYAMDIWRYLYLMESKLEWPRFNYMSKQKHLSEDMRCILIDWLVSVADVYKMNEHTIHLSVNYIDRFLSHMSVVRDKFQLLGTAAMMLAVKVEEVNILDTSEWVYLSGKTYTSRQVTRMEQLILKVIKFDVNVPTMVTFIQQLCVIHQLDKKTLHTAMYISELILLEGGTYLQYLPSMLAAASIVLARYILYKKDPWFQRLEASSGYNFKQLKPIVAKQYETFKDSPSKEQQTIQKKYKTEKYLGVARISPRALYLDECDNYD